MAQFVNYKKRSLTLPPGCKDLVDVLGRSQRQTKGQIASSGFPPLEIKKERFSTEGLAQIGRYVSMLLRSQGEVFMLSITAREVEFPVTLYRSRSEQTVAIVLITKEAHREQTIRAFFDQEGLKPVMDVRNQANPDEACGLAFALPDDVARATSLTTRILRDVYGLKDDAGLDFCYETTTNDL